MKYTSKLILNGEEYQFAAPEQGWQPGANTLLYLPLNSTDTYTDQSGNNVQTTNNGVTFGTYQGVDCGYFNSAHIQVTPFNIPNSTSMLAWCYCTGVDYDDGKIFDARVSGGGNFISKFSYNERVGYGFSYGVDLKDSSFYVLNKRVLFVITAENGSQNIYLKGDSVDLSKSAYGTFSGFTPTTMNVGNEHDNGAPRFFLGGISRLIVEDKIRTATEIQDYFNQTKSLYGIS